jgi:hypothetical protein
MDSRNQAGNNEDLKNSRNSRNENIKEDNK